MNDGMVLAAAQRLVEKIGRDACESGSPAHRHYAQLLAALESL